MVPWCFSFTVPTQKCPNLWLGIRRFSGGLATIHGSSAFSRVGFLNFGDLENANASKDWTTRFPNCGPGRSGSITLICRHSPWQKWELELHRCRYKSVQQGLNLFNRNRVRFGQFGPNHVKVYCKLVDTGKVELTMTDFTCLHVV